MGTRAVGLGAGGHASVVIEILRMDNRNELVDCQIEIESHTVRVY